MPSYRGIFKVGQKSKKLIECFADDQKQADLEFEKYASENNYIFIRSYRDTITADSVDELPKPPTVSYQAKVLKMIKKKWPLVTKKDKDTAEYLVSTGALIKIRTGYIHG